jgi:hypothetical protein
VKSEITPKNRESKEKAVEKMEKEKLKKKQRRKWTNEKLKKRWWRPLQFYFFLNHVLHRTERTPGEPTGRTPSIFLFLMFSFKNICFIQTVIFLKSVIFLTIIFFNLCLIDVQRKNCDFYLLLFFFFFNLCHIFYFLIYVLFF